MADYIARYSKGPDLPVVTHSPAGEAMVYTQYGTLAVANTLSGFICVEPYKQTWNVDSYGIPGIKSISEE